MNDPLFSLIEQEAARQKTDIPLIASENFCSAAVREALGSVLVNKYAEGKPGQRYYAGNKVVDQIETLAQERALGLFVPAEIRDGWHANVQPLSGSPANLAVMIALLEPGDCILSMALPAGGHLSHGHHLTLPGQLYEIHSYGVEAETEQLDYDAIEAQAKEVKPKLIICGASAYPRTIDFARFAAIAHEVGAFLLADISHLAGLVAAGAHPSPIPHADVVTTTTHKTLRGPRAALILCRQELAAQIDRGVFPGVQGGPHVNQIAATAVALEEAAQPEFKKYAQQVVKNAAALAEPLTRAGIRLVSGGTDNHLLLADLTSIGLTGGTAQKNLEQIGVITNANQIPFDARAPRDPSGLRLGTAAVTTLGADEAWCRELGQLIVDILLAQKPTVELETTARTLRQKLL